jgi:hypothetical protein
MVASEVAAKDACATRKPIPPNVPGDPCGFFIRTPIGAGFSFPCACDGGACTGCTIGRLNGIFLQGFV